MSIFQPAQDQAASGQSALKDLVGEGKKFKTEEDLARGKIESDRFVEKLQNELREMREELNKRLTTEEALKRAKETGVVEKQDNPPAQSPTPQRQEQATTPDIGSEVEKVLARREREKAVKSNIDIVTSLMTDLYETVEKAASVIQTKANELGMSVGQLQTLAADNPKAFFRLIGVEETKAPAESGATSWSRQKNTSALKEVAKTSTVTPGTYKWYTELRKNDPAAYFSTRVQLQMDKDAREKGEAFYK